MAPPSASYRFSQRKRCAGLFPASYLAVAMTVLLALVISIKSHAASHCEERILDILTAVRDEAIHSLASR